MKTSEDNSSAIIFLIDSHLRAADKVCVCVLVKIKER